MTSRLGLEEMPPPMRSGLEEVAPPMRSRLELEEVAPPMRSRREETTVPMRSRLGAMVKEEIQPATPRMVQPARYIIVTTLFVTHSGCSLSDS